MWSLLVSLVHLQVAVALLVVLLTQMFTKENSIPFKAAYFISEGFDHRYLAVICCRWFLFFKFILREREREREHAHAHMCTQASERESGRDGESQAGSVLSAVSAELDVGLEVMMLRSWRELKPRVGCLTSWATQAPLLPFNSNHWLWSYQLCNHCPIFWYFKYWRYPLFWLPWSLPLPRLTVPSFSGIPQIIRLNYLIILIIC